MGIAKQNEYKFADGRSRPSVENLLNRMLPFLIVFIPFSTFIGPANDAKRLLVVGICMAIIFIVGIFKGIQEKFPPYLLILSTLLVFLIFKFSLMVEGYPFPNYNIALAVGMSCSFLKRNDFREASIFFLTINLCILAYEFYTKDYLFVTIDTDGDIIGKKIYGGLADVFRAKGLCDGPTSLGSILILLALINKRNLYIVTICLVSAYFAVARFAIFGCIIIFVYSYSIFIFRNRGNIIVIISSICALSFSIFELYRILYYQDNFEFISSAMDFSSTGNEARITYLGQGIEYISNLDWFQMIFGIPVRLRSLGLNFESSFITLFVQSGIVVFICYFVIIFNIVEGSFEEILDRSLIVTASFLLGFFDPLGSGILMSYCLCRYSVENFENNQKIVI